MLDIGRICVYTLTVVANATGWKGWKLVKLDATKLEISMARACISLGDLSAMAGVPRATLSQAKHGVRNPSPRTVGRIAAALGIDPAELVELEERR